MSQMTDDVATHPSVEVTDAGREALAALAQVDGDAERPALFLGITGQEGGEFHYGFEWRRSDEAAGEDLTTDCGDFDLVVRSADLPHLRGATVDADPQFGVVIANPNRPQAAGGPGGAEDDSLRKRIESLFAETVNPALATHSGAIKLERIEDGVLYVSMLGGCQGCSGAQLTLQDGIERFIVETIPEITKVVDATDHTAGIAPYMS